MDHRLADYHDADALRAALSGVQTLVFVSSDGPSERVLVDHRNVIDAAFRCGVEHVAYLSSLDADVDSPFCYAVTNATTAMRVEARLGYSIVRVSIFAEFFERWPQASAGRGELRLPAGDGCVSLVARDDVARALAAVAMHEPSGRRFEITGPEALDMPTVADRHRTATGGMLRYVDVTPRQHRAAMARDGTDPW